MRRALIVAGMTLRNWTRIRSAVFFTIAFPLMLLLIFSTVFGGSGSPSFNLFVQNRDSPGESPSEISVALLETLDNTEVFNISHIPAEADASSFAEEAIGPLGGRYRILIIPEGFGSRLLNGTLETRLLVTRNTLESVLQGDDAPQFGQQDREEILQGAAALDEAIAALDVEEATLILVVDPGDPSGQVIQSILITVTNSFSNRLVGVGENIFIEEESVSQESFTAVDYYLPGLIGAFIMTSSVFGVTSQNTEFRKRGIIKRLSLTPLSRTEWIIGSVLAQTVLAFVLTVVMFAVGWAVFCR